MHNRLRQARTTALHLLTMTISTLLVACGNPSQRLDEYVFYDGPKFRLKVVRYYRNIPFNYLGEQAVVMCQSENTGEFSGHDPQDAGWRILGEAGDEEIKSAKQAALGVKDDYQVFGDRALAVKTHALNISFDACASFMNWDPSRLPPTMINPAEKPDSCAPEGRIDCRYYDFEGDRTPHYRQIRIMGDGQVSFAVSAPAFRNVQSLQVHTENNGALWHVDTVKSGTDIPTLRPDAIRSLSMQSIESGMEDINLAQWLESLLPEHSMVVWPDRPGECGETEATADPPQATRCAAVLFADNKGGSGNLYIALNPAMDPMTASAEFHSGTYHSGNQSMPVRSLRELRTAMR